MYQSKESTKIQPGGILKGTWWQTVESPQCPRSMDYDTEKLYLWILLHNVQAAWPSREFPFVGWNISNQATRLQSNMKFTVFADCHWTFENLPPLHKHLNHRSGPLHPVYKASVGWNFQVNIYSFFKTEKIKRGFFFFNFLTVLIPKMGGRKPQTQILVVKLFKVSIYIQLLRLPVPKAGFQRSAMYERKERLYSSGAGVDKWGLWWTK